MIFWNRRSSAPSFSMYWRYSSSVVAPMHCSSPRDRAGLNMFDASSDPDAPPAPTIVWSSSMNRITSFAFSSSFMTAFMRSSNWPRYFVPGDKRCQIEGHHAFSVKDPGDLLLDDPHRQPFGDGSFADARLPDKDGIVFLPAAQDLRDAFDLLFASDDGIKLVFGGQLGQVVPEIVENGRL